MKEFKGRTAFITGGASGLGLSIAKACAREGMNVCLVDFRQEAIDEALPIFKSLGSSALGILLDVSDRAAYIRAADEAEAAFGNIHLLVNNAGVASSEGNIWKADYNDMDFVIDVNFKSVLNGIRTILPRILRHGEEGHVVSTASTNALIPTASMVLYNSTKRAVLAIMESLAIDLRDTNVRSSVFCPGPFRTNLWQSTTALREKNADTLASSTSAAVEYSSAKVALYREPDDISDYFMQAIRRGDLFIITHSEFKPGWEAYAEAVTNAFPDVPYNQDFMDVYRDITRNPIYD